MKKTISKHMSWLLSVVMMFGVFVICSISNIKVNAASDVVERAIDWAIGTANDNSHDIVNKIDGDLITIVLRLLLPHLRTLV